MNNVNDIDNMDNYESIDSMDNIMPIREEEDSKESNDDSQKTKKPYTSSINRRIPIAVKLEAVEYAKSTSNNKAAMKYNVSEKSIRYWRKQEMDLRRQRHQISKITLHKGKNKSFVYDEKEMWVFTETNRKLGNLLTSWALIIELLKREPTVRKMSKNSLLKWCSRFESKYYLSFKISKQEGKLMLADALYQLKNFFQDIKNKRLNENVDTIISVDETPLFFNMPKVKRAIHRGIREIILETQKQEEVEVSVILAVAATGQKLPPFVIFKRWGKKDMRDEEDLNQLAIVKRGQIFFEYNEHAWSNNEIMEKWFQKVYWPFLFKNSETGRGLIILDMESSHVSKNFLDLLTSRNQLFSLIPAGLTRIVQPLDVKINKPFKKYLQEYYDKKCNEVGKNLENIKKECLLELILNTWYDDFIIKKEDIYDAFKYCGISNNLDGSENHLIRNFDDIAEGVVKQDFAKDDSKENKDEKDKEKEEDDNHSNQSYTLDSMNSFINNDESNFDIDLSYDMDEKKSLIYNSH